LFTVPKAYWFEAGTEIRDMDGDLFSYAKFLSDPKDTDIEGFEDVEDDETV
jgi:hypothetical protein